jgi:acetate kinase
MKILVANLGSTSFKYRLFDMAGERLLARGGVERIGSAQSPSFVDAGGRREEQTVAAKNHAAAVRLCLQQLLDPKRQCLRQAGELAAIAFKAVHAEGISGVQRVDTHVLDAMEAYSGVAPAHNPPYVAAMRLLAKELPEIPLVAVFETAFHLSIDPEQRLYAVPAEWTKVGIVRHGFHGASHRYVAERCAQLLNNREARVISCHLGGSSSLCAVENGYSVATSMGFSPQSGLPQGNRVGDFDVFALPVVMKATGKNLEQVLEDLATRSGLFGLSGGHSDLRDIEADAAKGGPVSRQALNVYVAAVRHYLGAYLLLLGGADAIVFTGGIGENSASMRAAICDKLDWFGIVLDQARNQTARGECPIHAQRSRAQLWAMPTNEELIVARQTKKYLEASAPVAGGS